MEALRLFSSLLHVTPAELSEAIPGEWEELDNPYEPTLDRTFGRSTEGLSIDCVVTVLYVEDAIEVSKPAIAWIHHQKFTKAGKAKRSIMLNSLDAASRSHLAELASSVAEVAALERKNWKTCQNCGKRLPRGLMHDPEICMSCAPGVLGVVY